MTTEPAAPPQKPGAPASGIPETVARLRRTFASGRTRSNDWRKDQLLKLEKMMVENEAAIATALAEDLDRTPFEAWLTDSASTAAGPAGGTACSRFRSFPAGALSSTSRTGRC